MAAEPVLVVDDHPQNLKLARIILEGEGYEIRTAADGEDALRVLESFRPRLVLVDLRMPRMNGLELTRRLKGAPSTSSIVIIAMTAEVMPGDLERALAAGCDGYLTKPIRMDALCDLVARHLRPPSA